MQVAITMGSFVPFSVTMMLMVYMLAASVRCAQISKGMLNCKPTSTRKSKWICFIYNKKGANVIEYN